MIRFTFVEDFHPQMPDFHSRTTAPEILRDFDGERLDYWVTGYGTGGTLKGVARVLKKERPETKVVLCQPPLADLFEGSRARRPEAPPGVTPEPHGAAGIRSTRIAQSCDQRGSCARGGGWGGARMATAAR